MSIATSPENELIARAQGAEREALEQLIRAIVPNVERQLLRYPISDEDRRDLLQSTLLTVLRRLGSFRGESNFSTWLFRVTANEALMLMRSQRRQRVRLVSGMDLEDLGHLVPSKGGADEEPHDRPLFVDRERELQDALAELPDDYRALVMAHYRDELGLQEIADKLCLSESAVRSRLRRARSRLREILRTTSPAAA